MSSSSGSSSSGQSKRPSGPTAQDLPPSGMKDLLSKGVVSMRRTERPLDNNASSSPALASAIPTGFGIGPLRKIHGGTEVRTADGGHWLVHKGDNFGCKKGGNTVVTDARNMSGDWKPQSGWTGVTPGTRVTDFVRTGGKGYGLWTDNCNMAASAFEEKFRSGKKK